MNNVLIIDAKLGLLSPHLHLKPLKLHDIQIPFLSLFLEIDSNEINSL